MTPEQTRPKSTWELRAEAAEAELETLRRRLETAVSQTDEALAIAETLRRERDEWIEVARGAEDRADAAESARLTLQAQVESLTAEKHGAYDERNRLVAVLSKLWPSHWCWHPEDDTTWDDEWRTIICIHSPAGQLTWHIKLSEHALFSHLPKGANHWDGHTTEQKYARLAALLPAPEGPDQQS